LDVGASSGALAASEQSRIKKPKPSPTALFPEPAATEVASIPSASHRSQASLPPTASPYPPTSGLGAMPHSHLRGPTGARLNSLASCQAGSSGSCPHRLTPPHARLRAANLPAVPFRPLPERKARSAGRSIRFGFRFVSSASSAPSVRGCCHGPRVAPS